MYRVVAQPAGRARRVAALILFSLVTAFGLGLIVGQWNANAVLVKSIELNNVNSVLESEITSLQRSLDKADLSVEVNETAIVQLRDRLDKVLREKVDLEYALAFYENLIVSASENASLEMFEFKAFATNEEDVYEFSILLGQDVRDAKTVSGEVDFSIIGADGRTDRIEFTPDNSLMGFPLTYRFKYFQDLAGKIRLPADFNPKRAAVILRPAGGGSSVEAELDWRLDS